MAELPKYHISEQSAYALLQPVQASLRELEARSRHYLSRLNIASEADRSALAAASQALASARQELDRIIGASQPPAGSAR